MATYPSSAALSELKVVYFWRATSFEKAIYWMTEALGKMFWWQKVSTTHTHVSKFKLLNRNNDWNLSHFFSLRFDENYIFFNVPELTWYNF